MRGKNLDTLLFLHSPTKRKRGTNNTKSSYESKTKKIKNIVCDLEIPGSSNVSFNIGEDSGFISRNNVSSENESSDSTEINYIVPVIDDPVDIRSFVNSCNTNSIVNTLSDSVVQEHSYSSTHTLGKCNHLDIIKKIER